MNKILKTPKAKLDLIDLASYLYNADPMSRVLLVSPLLRRRSA